MNLSGVVELVVFYFRDILYDSGIVAHLFLMDYRLVIVSLSVFLNEFLHNSISHSWEGNSPFDKKYQYNYLHLDP